MLIIGLTGGIASGKSAVAAELANLGAKVLNADEAAHRVINYPEVRQLLTERWGIEILQPSGEINRQALAERVFSPGESSVAGREFLEKLLHPRIRTEFEAELAKLKNSGIPAFVIDAPLLLEAGWDQICDILLFVESPLEDRLRRAETLRNWTPTDFAAREAVQMPIEEKRHRATHVIANDGTLEQLRERVRDFWLTLKTSRNS